jgi:hypothetical protein
MIFGLKVFWFDTSEHELNIEKIRKIKDKYLTNLILKQFFRKLKIDKLA